MTRWVIQGASQSWASAGAVSVRDLLRSHSCGNGSSKKHYSRRRNLLRLTKHLLIIGVLPLILVAADFLEPVQQSHHNTNANILWGTMRDEAAYASSLGQYPVSCENASRVLQVF